MPSALPVERTLNRTPEEKRPDVRPQLREFLAWYEEVLGRIESWAVTDRTYSHVSPKARAAAIGVLKFV